MKKLLVILPLFFIGCAVDNPTKIKEFTKCYIHKLPAPFWVCFNTTFMSVGKVHSKKISTLSKQEAYAIGIKLLNEKLLIKTKDFLRRLNIKEFDFNKIKSFIVTNALDDGSWYDKKTNILYVKVIIDKKEFKNYLFSLIKGYDKKVLEVAFDESF